MPPEPDPTSAPSADEQLARIALLRKLADMLPCDGELLCGECTADRSRLLALADSLASLPEDRRDRDRLDWLGEHAMRDVPDGEAEIRIEYDEGEGFRVREWGQVQVDEEGLTDWQRRFYRSTLYPTFREAIDAARAARPSEETR